MTAAPSLIAVSTCCGLLGLVLVGVVVGDLAVLAELGDLGLEQRLVERLVTGGLRLGQQQRDGAAAAVTARLGGVVGPARGGPEREQGGQCRRQSDA